MNERMAHFLTAPYMSIYYNAGSGDPSAAAALRRLCERTEGETGPRARSASSFVYFLLFKVGVKVNDARRKIPTECARVQLLISRHQM